jgi:hypothetical protein
MEPIEARLERLEDQNARLERDARRARRIAMTFALGAVIAVGAGAMQNPGLATVSQLNIVGQNGKVRIAMGVTANGTAEMDFFDAGGDSHIRMEVDDQGGFSILRMRDIKDNTRVDLGINPQTNGGFLVINGLVK